MDNTHNDENSKYIYKNILEKLCIQSESYDRKITFSSALEHITYEGNLIWNVTISVNNVLTFNRSIEKELIEEEGLTNNLKQLENFVCELILFDVFTYGLMSSYKFANYRNTILLKHKNQ